MRHTLYSSALAVTLAATLSIASTSSTLSAQETATAPASVRISPPPGYLLRLEVANPHQLIELAWKTVPGQMAKDDMLKDIIDQAIVRYQPRSERMEKLAEMVREAGDDTFDPEFTATLEKLALVRFEQMEAFVYVDTADGDIAPSVLVLVEPADESRETWRELMTVMHEKMAEQAESSETFESMGIKGLTYEMDAEESDGIEAIWVLEPGPQTALGFGSADLANKLAPADGSATTAGDSAQVVHHTGISWHMDFAKAMELGEADADEEDIEQTHKVLDVLGLDFGLLSWGYDIDGDHFRQNYRMELRGGARGLIAAMAQATDTAPNVPLPQPALLHWRGALDIQRAYDAVIQAVAAANEGDAWEPTDSPITIDDVTSTFSGGMAFGLSAPAAGQAVPRLAMAMNLKGAEAFAAFRTKLEELMEGIAFKDSTYKDVTWTRIDIPNSSVPMIPSFAVVNDLLIVGENPVTLKQMIRIALEGEIPAPIDVSQGPTPLPSSMAPSMAPSGGQDVTANLTFDVGAIYTMVEQSYMPMIQLGMGVAMNQAGRRGEPLWEAADLPSARELAPWLGVGTGAMVVSDDAIYFSTASSLGDPLTAALMCVVAPLGGEMAAVGLDAAISQMEVRIARQRMGKVWSGLRTWRTSFGSGTQMPRDLGDLVSRGLIEDFDLFIVPGDEDPTEMEYEDLDGEIQSFPCSYRYAPDSKIKVKVDMLEFSNQTPSPMQQEALMQQGIRIGYGDEETRIVLYEAKPNRRKSRIVVSEQGEIYVLPEETFLEVIGNR